MPLSYIRNMEFGIIREGKTPPDERTPLAPAHCKELLSAEPFQQLDISITVQRSPIRCFPDSEYAEAGIALAEDVSNCEVILGVKEVPLHMLADGKTMMFFSHTIKKQPYNRELLREVLKRNIRLIDYETLVYPGNGRVLGFGRYAGIVGAYNALIAYGKREQTYTLQPAHQLGSIERMMDELQQLELQKNPKIIVSGGGKVAFGAKELLSGAGIREVSIPEFLNREFDEPVYCNADILDYHERDGRPPRGLGQFLEDTAIWENTFKKFSRVANIFISAHFWDNRSAAFFTEEDVKKEDFRIRVIADITCDIKGSVPTTLRASTIAAPLYGYNRFSGRETDPFAKDSITIMAVDNLPCEIPKDASEGFSEDLTEKVMPLFFNNDPQGILENATIAANGKLTPRFQYLQDYVDGKA